MKPKRLDRTVIYENPWVNVYADKVQFPDGRVIEKHHLLDFERESVAVLVENAQHELLFVHAYRYTIDAIEWEIPAGGIDPQESILAAAQREVYEETGFETTEHEWVYSYNPLVGISNQRSHISRCQATVQTGAFDKNEVEAFRWISPSDVKAMIREKQIRDGHSLLALSMYFSKLI